MFCHSAWLQISPARFKQVYFDSAQLTANTVSYRAVNKSMTDQERNIITSVWNDMGLRMKLEDDPYSLTQDELISLKNNDRLNAMLENLKHDVLAQKALRNSLKYHV